MSISSLLRIVAVALQRFQSGIVNKVYKYVSVSAAMLSIPVPVFSVLVEEDYDAYLPVDQTPILLWGHLASCT